MPDDVSRRSFLKQSAAGAAAGGFKNERLETLLSSGMVSSVTKR